jgi:hypothetical protein
MSGKYEEKYGKYKVTLGETTYQFNTIFEIPVKIAYDMYLREDWFSTPYELPSDYIYVEINKKEDNITPKIRQGERISSEKSFFVEKNKELKKINLEEVMDDIPPKKFIDMCYATYRSKDIYLYFVKYFNKNKVLPDSSLNKQFLYHYAWLMNNLNKNFDIIDKDEFVKAIKEKIGGIEDLKSILLKLKGLKTSEIFSSDYYNSYKFIVQNTSKFINRLDNDLIIANVYINMIHPQKLKKNNNNNKIILFGGKLLNKTIKKMKSRKMKSRKMKSKK